MRSAGHRNSAARTSPSIVFSGNSRRVYAHLRLACLRQHHDFPGPLRGPHPAGPGAPAERELPRADDAAKFRRLRGQHRLRAEAARRRRKHHGHTRLSRRRSSISIDSMHWVCRRNACWCCPTRYSAQASSPPIWKTIRSPRSTPGAMMDSHLNHAGRNQGHHARHRCAGRLRRHASARRGTGGSGRALRLRSRPGPADSSKVWNFVA